MTLENILRVYSPFDIIHIGTEHGSGWLFTGEARAALGHIGEEYGERPVVNIYRHEGRQEGRSCCLMLPGLAVIVAGAERGEF